MLVRDVDDDCGLWFAATLREHRGRGLVSALLRRALSEARARGCTTSTMEATAMGAPIYARLGFDDVGRLQAWERRAG